MKELKGKKVFVGLSGGVDSATTAALLVRAGAQVTGVFIKGWYPPDMPCTWAADRRDAMRVAARLHIPFHTLDGSAAYKRGVIDYLLAEYAAGRTPNPDVMCNREVKFGIFAEFAFAHGADFIATGHYARVARAGEAGARLVRGADPAKDQSYFLWAVPQEVLARTLFPLGDLRKQEVRALARKFDLPVSEKKDSQGVCFLGDVSVEEFLRAEFHPELGRAVDEAGREVGMHSGAVLHTLGERVALSDATPGPWYVVAKHMEENELVVSHKRAPATPARAAIALRECNWLADPALATAAQYRYHGPLMSGRVVASGGGYVFEPAEPFPEPPAPGQSLVAYAGERCVGGGIME